MHLKGVLTLILAFVCSQDVFSQSGLFPGYYIDKNGDSIRCNFSFNDWKVTPKTVTVEMNNATHTFGTSDIRGFGISGYGDYTVATVRFHTNPVSGVYLPDEYSDSTQMEKCFLKVIVQDTYSLYELAAPGRWYLFVSVKGEAPFELVYRKKRNQTHIEEDARYKKDLFQLLVKEGLSDRYINKVNQITYRANDIKQIINALNEKHSGIKYTKSRKNHFEFDLYAGGIMTSFTGTINGRYAQNVRFGSATAPTGGISMLYFVPGHFKSFALGLSIGYSKYAGTASITGADSNYRNANNYTITNYNENLATQNAYVLLDVYAMYIFNPLNRVKFFVKAGLNNGISAATDNDIHSTYSAKSVGLRSGTIPINDSAQGTTSFSGLRKRFYQVNGGGGLITGRHKVAINYFLPATLTEDKSFGLSMVGVYYHYTFAK